MVGAMSPAVAFQPFVPVGGHPTSLGVGQKPTLGVLDRKQVE